MGIVYANDQYYDFAIDGSSSVALRAALDALLLKAGWYAARDITDGRVYLGASPQGYACRLFIQDTGGLTPNGLHYLDIKFCNVSETVFGETHGLIYNAGRTYRAVACPCQFFIWLANYSEADYTDAARGYDVAGGIPYVSNHDTGNECGGGAATPITNIFWSCSSGLGWESPVYLRGHSFRNFNVCDYHWSCCENNVVWKYDPSSEFDAVKHLQLIPVAPLSFPAYKRISNLKNLTGAALRIEPYVYWDGFVRGQLYNAFIEARKVNLETEVFDDEDTDFKWINYAKGDDPIGYWTPLLGYGTHYFSLFILKGNPMEGGIGGTTDNYAY